MNEKSNDKTRTGRSFAVVGETTPLLPLTNTSFSTNRDITTAVTNKTAAATTTTTFKTAASSQSFSKSNQLSVDTGDTENHQNTKLTSNSSRSGTKLVDPESAETPTTLESPATRSSDASSPEFFPPTSSIGVPVVTVEVVTEKSPENNSSTPSPPTSGVDRTATATDNIIVDSVTTRTTTTSSNVNTDSDSTGTDTTSELRFTAGNYFDSTIMTLSVSAFAALTAIGISNGIFSVGTHAGAAAASAQAVAVITTFGGGISGFTQAKKSLIEIQNRLRALEKGNVDIKNRLCSLEKDNAEIKNRLRALENDNVDIKNRLGAVENRLDAVENRLGAVEKQLELVLEKLEMMRLARKVRIFRTTEEGHMKEVFVTFDEIVGETTMLDADDGGKSLLAVAQAKASNGTAQSNPFFFKNSVLDQLTTGEMKVFLSHTGRPILADTFKALCLDDILSDHYCGRCVQIEMTVKKPVTITAVDEKLFSLI